MSYGPLRPGVRYAPGLGGQINGQIDSIIRGWRKAGIGVPRKKKEKR